MCETEIFSKKLEVMMLKYGKIAQIKNIIRWLQNYQKTGYRLCDVTERTSDKQIQERERKLRADPFQPPQNVEHLIDRLKQIVKDYHEGISQEGIQQEWNNTRPQLKQIFHEERVLPRLIVEKIHSNE